MGVLKNASMAFSLVLSGSVIVFDQNNVSAQYHNQELIAVSTAQGTEFLSMDGDTEFVVSGAYDAKISPDGTRLAYSKAVYDMDNIIVTHDIFVADFDGSNEVNVTNSADKTEYSPYWLPSGDELVLTIVDDDTNQSGIFRLNVDSYDVNLIINGKSSEWISIDYTEDRIAFIDSYYQDEIAVIDLDGTDYEVIGDVEDDEEWVLPSFSPDGSKIAFFRLTDTSESLSYISLDGMHVTDILTYFDNEEYIYENPGEFPVWSPDSGSVLFNNTTQIDSQKPTAGVYEVNGVNGHTVLLYPGVFNTVHQWWSNGSMGHGLCNGLEPTIVGTEDDDVLVGTNETDVIAGLGGNDRIEGLGSSDVICGGDGDDDILGGQGWDTIYGGSGDDELKGGNNPDTIVDLEGNNTVYGGSGSEQITLGSGNDVVYGGFGDDVINAGGGNDQVHGQDGDDYLDGELGENYSDGGNGEDQCYNAVTVNCEVEDEVVH